VNSSPKLVELERKGRLVFLELNVDNLTPQQYNAMFTTREFWEGVNATHALVFQTDAWLCEDAPVSPDDFLEYDYVGAPAVNRWGKLKISPSFQNGGFSLRNVDAMKRTIDACGFTPRKRGEDVFFSVPCKKANSHVAPNSVAQHFVGHQQELDGKDITPLALHAPWKFYSDMGSLEMKCSGITNIKENYKK
jgi:hypothetical protein